MTRSVSPATTSAPAQARWYPRSDVNTEGRRTEPSSPTGAQCSVSSVGRMSAYPYADRFTIHRSLPERGTARGEVLAELRAMASEEDAFWETGKCSGTMYCEDHDHYHFM